MIAAVVLSLSHVVLLQFALDNDLREPIATKAGLRSGNSGKRKWMTVGSRLPKTYRRKASAVRCSL